MAGDECRILTADRKVGFEAGGGFSERQTRERRDGINPAGAQKDESGIPGFAEFEEIDCAVEVLVNEIAGVGAIHASKDARVGRAVKDPVGHWKGLEKCAVANVSNAHINALRTERLDIHFAAFAAQVVKSDDCEPWRMLQQVPGDDRPGEAADSGDEEGHGKVEGEKWKEKSGKRKEKSEKRKAKSSENYQASFLITYMPTGHVATL